MRILALFLISNCFAVYIPPPNLPLSMTNPMFMHPYFVASSTSYQFKGYFKNGTQVDFSSCFYKDSLGRTFVRLDDNKFFGGKNDSLRRFPEDFDSLVAMTVNARNDTARYRAMPWDSGWVFNRAEGRLSLFTNEPNTDNYSYMRFGNHEMIPYNEDTVYSKLYQNKESAALLNAKSTGTTISILMAIGGAGLLIGGLLASDNTTTDGYGNTTHTFDPSPLLFIGGAVTLGSWIPYLMVKDNFIKAVYKYNF